MPQLTRFCLARHGETDWNAERRLQGQTDIPLNALGKKQAIELAQALKHSGLSFDALYSSHLQRAFSTAKPVAQALAMDVIAAPTLQERHFGVLQGLRLDDTPQANPEVWHAYRHREPDHDLDGGESINQFAKRIHDALLSLHQQHCGQTIMIVAHGGVLDAAYRIASGQSLQEQRMVLVPNASLNWISFDGQSWSIERWADTSHLSHGALDELEY